jgi:hypothetical protein
MNLPSTVYIRWGDKVISRPVDQWELTPTDQYPHGIWMALVGRRLYPWGVQAFATEAEANGPERAMEEQEAYEWWRSQQ